jgi:hypothetical protein
MVIVLSTSDPADAALVAVEDFLVQPLVVEQVAHGAEVGGHVLMALDTLLSTLHRLSEPLPPLTAARVSYGLLGLAQVAAHLPDGEAVDLVLLSELGVVAQAAAHPLLAALGQHVAAPSVVRALGCPELRRLLHAFQMDRFK